ncbi:gene transfer agent family protein [Aquibium carbonis]|uniref:Gene transfer agent family protein n=1 Tax=Aquibium carbonis TaxID=2495581 RepID=A0A429YT37_9HYPH|nr:gene transfer agent family protein [Aquibium carbonis]RST84542.1 gene transfer agent family protein [Aquibium carbonis]
MTHANARRGEITAELDGTRRRLCLTLGALAELESAFAAEDLSALVARFSTGRLSARDMARVIGAGLRGAGAATADEEVLAMTTPGGAAGFAAIVAELLAATFGEARPSVEGGLPGGGGKAAPGAGAGAVGGDAGANPS